MTARSKLLGGQRLKGEGVSSFCPFAAPVDRGSVGEHLTGRPGLIANIRIEEPERRRCGDIDRVVT